MRDFMRALPIIWTCPRRFVDRYPSVTGHNEFGIFAEFWCFMRCAYIFNAWFQDDSERTSLYIQRPSECVN